ncbi:MAG: response regulator [Deltaproteobacteria bacterium]|nr:response regulator [Deltaproteobacteria bacterium]
MTILVVEDNPVNAMILEAHLKRAGYETAVAKDGKSALDYLSSGAPVELMISDIMMPEMDGIQLLGKIKERPEWEDIQVIMCSALSDLETVKKAVKAGCTHFLIKPVERRDLLRKVQEALRGNRAVLDTKKNMMTRLGLDEAHYEEIAGVFLARVRDRIARLESEMTGGNAPAPVLDLAELHENAVYFGAERLKDVVEKIRSKALSSGEDDAGSLLIRELRLVQKALEAHIPKAEPPAKAKKAQKRTGRKPKKGKQTEKRK